jgi:hypothetical protein
VEKSFKTWTPGGAGLTRLVVTSRNLASIVAAARNIQKTKKNRNIFVKAFFFTKALDK